MEQNPNLGLPPVQLQLHVIAVTFTRHYALLIHTAAFYQRESRRNLTGLPMVSFIKESFSGLQYQPQEAECCISPNLRYYLPAVSVVCPQERKQYFAARHFLVIVI